MSDNAHRWKNIFDAFQCYGEVDQISQYGSGHINDTFLVETVDSHSPNYTFRCVNTNVFRNIDGLMNNIAIVTDHILKKLAQQQPKPSMIGMRLIRTRDDAFYAKDNLGNIWTCYQFVPGETHEHYYDVELAKQAGFAYGQFVALLQDLDPALLCDTIPQFHDLNLRLAHWDDAKQKANADDVQEIQQWVDFVERRVQPMQLLIDLKARGEIPLRITHNDTKCNNVLFDKNHQAVCVIDLDTVMPGVLAYDFADAVRTATTAHDEDEKDIEKVVFNKEAFSAFTKNYVEQVESFATAKEIESLATTITYIPYMLGLRFLTDHLAGDTYFKTKYRGHNMVRARNQFRFVEILEQNQQWINEVVKNAANKVTA